MFVWLLVQQGKVQVSNWVQYCIHVCKSDKNEAWAGKLLWVFVSSEAVVLWLNINIHSDSQPSLIEFKF